MADSCGGLDVILSFYSSASNAGGVGCGVDFRMDGSPE